MVDQLKLTVPDIIVNRLGATDAYQIHTAVLTELSNLVRGIHRVIAANVNEVAHVMSLQHIDHSFEIFVLSFFELIPARPNRSGSRSVSQQ